MELESHIKSFYTNLMGVNIENEPLTGISPVKLLLDKSLDSTMTMVLGYTEK